MSDHVETLKTVHAFIHNWTWAATEDDEFPLPDDLDAAFAAAIAALEASP